MRNSRASRQNRSAGTPRMYPAPPWISPPPPAPPHPLSLATYFAAAQAAHGDPQAGAHAAVLADDRGRGHAYLVQVDVGGRAAGLPHLVVLRADGQPRRPARDQERGDPPAGRGSLVGPREDHEHV